MNPLKIKALYKPQRYKCKIFSHSFSMGPEWIASQGIVGFPATQDWPAMRQKAGVESCTFSASCKFSRRLCSILPKNWQQKSDAVVSQEASLHLLWRPVCVGERHYCSFRDPSLLCLLCPWPPGSQRQTKPKCCSTQQTRQRRLL